MGINSGLACFFVLFFTFQAICAELRKALVWGWGVVVFLNQKMVRN